MTVTARLLPAVLAASLTFAPPAARAASPLPTEAAEHNERGMALYAEGDLEQAYAELALAYAAMPDARRYDVGRDIVLGSMRAALLDLYDKTGEARHLCRARDILVVHLEALLLAFGETTTIEDVPGTIWRIEQVEARLREHPQKPHEPAKPCTKEPARVRRPQTTPPVIAASAPAPRPRDTGWPWTIAGGVALGLGGALLGAMSYALVMRRASFVEIRQFDALARDRGSATPNELAVVAALAEAAERHRTLAVATGVAGGLLVATGVAAMIIGQVRARRNRLALHPAFSPWSAGFALRGSF